MIKNIDNDNFSIYLNRNESGKHSTAENIYYEAVCLIHDQIIYAYKKNIKGISDREIPEVLIMMVANIFANISHRIISSKDVSTRLALFEELQDALHGVSTELFLTLETYFIEDEIEN